MSQEISILVIDDTAAHRSLIKKAIEKASITSSFVEAGSLAEAKSLLITSDSPPEASLALVDLNLGDGRGTDLISAMRQTSAYGSIPIIVLSTSARSEDRDESLLVGANDFLTKSSDLLEFRKEVASTVSDWLDKTL